MNPFCIHSIFEISFTWSSKHSALRRILHVPRKVILSLFVLIVVHPERHQKKQLLMLKIRFEIEISSAFTINNICGYKEIGGKSVPVE